MPQNGTISRACAMCGVEFLARVRAVAQGNGRFCSKACFGLSCRERLARTCLTCGASFETIASQLAQGKGIYCSKPCWYGRTSPSIEISPDGFTGVVPLSASRGVAHGHTLIDADDAAFVGQWSWHLRADGYAARTHQRDLTLLLHRELLGLKAGDVREIDHIDRDRLNNRRSNLRIVSKTGNMQNVPSHEGTSSKYRGVTWFARTGKWRAYVKAGGRAGKFFHLGYFTSEIDAAEAAKAARLKLLPCATD